MSSNQGLVPYSRGHMPNLPVASLRSLYQVGERGKGGWTSCRSASTRPCAPPTNA